MGARVAGGLSGGLAALALPPFSLWPLVFVALVPLARYLDGPRRARRDAVRAGLAFGAIHYGILLHWVPFTLHGMVPGGAVAGLLLLVILAGIGGLQALALRALLVGGRAPPILALPAVWAGTEFLLARAGPLAFPWTPLALSLAPTPEAAGIAEWVGVGGVGLWIAGVNGAVASVGRPPRSEPAPGAGAGERSRRSLLAGGTALALAAGPTLWGVHRAGHLPVRSLPPVGLVQLDLNRADLLEPEARDRAAWAAVDRVLGQAGEVPGRSRPTLVILPEAPFGRPWGPEAESRMEDHARALGVPLLVGAHGAAPGEAGRPGERRNLTLLVSSHQPVQSVHGKVRLVPGVERPGLVPGPRGGVREVSGLRFGVLICFESAFGTEGRRLRRNGAELLVNPTNDGWYAPSRGARGGAAHAQHRAHLVLRAVETRSGAVRSAVGGELLVVEPTGRVSVSRPPGGEGLLPVVPTTSDRIPAAVRFGDLGGGAALLLLLLLGARTGVISRRDRMDREERTTG